MRIIVTILDVMACQFFENQGFFKGLKLAGAYSDMKNFIPLIIWFVVAVPVMYVVKNVVICRYPAYSEIIMGVTLVVVFGAFLIIRHRIIKNSKKD